MPTGICKSCGKTTDWRNTRGSKIGDYACWNCGGELQPAQWTADGYVPRFFRHKVDQGRVMHCPACGARRKAKGHKVKTLNREFRVRVYGVGRRGPFPAGTLVCWSHELE